MPDLHSKAEATFFGAKGYDLKRLRRKGTVFSSKDPVVIHQLQFTSGGSKSFDAADFDAFATAGLYFGRTHLIEALEKHRVSAVPGRSEFDHIISDELFEVLVRSRIQKCLAIRIVKLLREATDKPIFVCEQPLPSNHIRKKGMSVWRDAAAFEKIITPIWRDELAKLEQQYRFQVLEQPVETVNQNLFLTHHRNSAGAIRLLDGLNVVHKRKEYAHMNADYGAIVMTEVIDAASRGIVESSSAIGDRVHCPPDASSS
ncbi:hypothetical protein [Rhizobium sp. Root482]|uniref:hypothetical protein n=1 Tax=Rhizobium sp. Root482 TaxID=1736543 RepID=UPI0012E3AC45|nr:hypothetical protein [Rhizobium sp. Root482]